MVTIEQLKSELQEKENGCGIKFDDNGMLINCGEEIETGCGLNWLCPICQAEIQALKKGISACEEILNSQQTKIHSEFQNVATSGTAETEGEKHAHPVALNNGNKTADTQTLIRQAVKQKDKEIETQKKMFKKVLEEIKKELRENYWHRKIDRKRSAFWISFIIDRVAEQLTTKEEEKE